MASNTISSRITLTGHGASSDPISFNETKLYNVTQPSVDSGALVLTTTAQVLGNMDGTPNVLNNYLYIKNTDASATMNISTGINHTSMGYIVFTGTPTATETISITDTAGTTKVYVAAAAEDTANRIFANGSPAIAVASLIACIAASAGHAGSILTAVGGAGTGVCTSASLTLYQAVGGLAGNTTITKSAGLLNTLATSFTLGTSNTPIKLGVIGPGEWTAIPIDKSSIVNVSALSGTCSMEYAWWSIT